MSILNLHGDLREQLRAIYDLRKKSYRKLAGHAWIMHPATWAHIVDRRIAGPALGIFGYEVVLDGGVTEGCVYFVVPTGAAR